MVFFVNFSSGEVDAADYWSRLAAFKQQYDSLMAERDELKFQYECAQAQLQAQV